MREIRLKGLTARAERGSALVFFAVAMPVMVMLCGLGIDTGNLVVQRADAQKAADAAAIAAVNKYLDVQSNSQAISEAHVYAGKNGYSTGVTVNNPPTSGPKAGNINAYEVIIEKDVQKYFIGMLYSGAWKNKVRSVATVDYKAVGFGVITLDPNDCQSLRMDSNAKLNVTGGGVYVNSNCASNALNMDSNNTAKADEISIVGGAYKGSNASATCKATPCPATGQQPVPDPYAGLTPPTAPTALAPLPVGPGGSMLCSAGGEMKISAGDWTFMPGRYPCKVFLDSVATATFKTGNYVFEGGFEANSSAIITWERGIYITKGMGLKVFSNSVIRDPAGGPKGVLLYNTCNSPCGNSGKIWLDSNGNFQVTPYGAPYANVLIWQDRNSATELTFDSNTFSSPGAVYAKNAKIYFDSNAAAPLQFVAANVRLDSNAVVNVDISNQAKVEIKDYRLIE